MSQHRLNPIPGPLEQEAAQPPARKERDLFGREPVGHPDWSHRRGEPRVFALIWMLFLMGVTILMFSAFMDALSISTSITRPAAKSMIVATTLGVVMLWPAIRLSQRPSEKPVRAVMRDLFVILVPAQAVIWPHALSALAAWPLSVLLAIATAMAAWALVVAGIIAIGDATRGKVPAWVWMLVVLVVCVAVPLFALLTGRVAAPRPDMPRIGWMLSPVSAMLELTRDRDTIGHPTPVFPAQWRLLGATACVGVSLLLLAGASNVASRRRNP